MVGLRHRGRYRATSPIIAGGSVACTRRHRRPCRPCMGAPRMPASPDAGQAGRRNPRLLFLAKVPQPVPSSAIQAAHGATPSRRAERSAAMEQARRRTVASQPQDLSCPTCGLFVATKIAAYAPTENVSYVHAVDRTFLASVLSNSASGCKSRGPAIRNHSPRV